MAAFLLFVDMCVYVFFALLCVLTWEAKERVVVLSPLIACEAA